ncbi:MAG TPA: hypothetical protein VMY06_14560 [Sedimentisphaerales bacterium]|nr:hypothetical protein [Sedimentisphaerales bacterium]HUU15557.1 hypothetical protein [Sedimentisphaerales bacterium]
MAKRIAILLLVFVLNVTAWSVVRPPDLEPNDVPFAYEPNLCLSPIMDWQIAEPNIAAIYGVRYHDSRGLDTELTAVDPNGPEILVQKLGRFKDPEGGWSQYWQIMFTISGEGVHYLELETEDKLGRWDCRTLLVLSISDDTYFILPGSPPPLPVSRIKEAQRFWQYAKKVGYPVTKPTSVLN